MNKTSNEGHSSTNQSNIEQEQEEDQITPTEGNNSGMATKIINDIEGDTEGDKKTYEYNLHDFGICKTSTRRFWLGQIVGIRGYCNEEVRALSVHWFEVGNKKDAWDGAYYPCYKAGSKAKRKKKSSSMSADKSQRIPWIDEVESESVLACFGSLTSKRTIPMRVRKAIVC